MSNPFPGIALSYRIYEVEDDYSRRFTIFAHALFHFVQDDELKRAASHYIASLRDAYIIHEEDFVKTVISRGGNNV